MSQIIHGMGSRTKDIKIECLKTLISFLQKREVYRMGSVEIGQHYRDLTEAQNELIEILISQKNER